MNSRLLLAFCLSAFSLSSAIPVSAAGAPVAVNDTAIAKKGATVLLKLAANDLGAAPLSIAMVDSTSAAGGTIVDAGNGAVLYTAPSSSGSDTFTYSVTDGALNSNTATVTVALLDGYDDLGYTRVWERDLMGGGSTGATVVNQGVAFDHGMGIFGPKGDQYVTGYFSGTVDFDSGTGVDNHTAVGATDIFVTKIKADGSYAWTKTFGGSLDDQGAGIATDSNNNVFIVGSYTTDGGGVDFDPSVAGVDTHTGAGGTDIFITSLDTDGNYRWTRTIGGALDDQATAIAVDSGNKVFVTGSFNEAIDFNPSGTSDVLGGAGLEAIFVTQLNTDNTYGWTRAVTADPSVNPSINILSNAIAVDTSGHVAYTGSFISNVDIDFDPTAGVDMYHAYILLENLFVTVLNSDGSYGWTHKMPSAGSGSDYIVGKSVTMDSSSNVYITGIFQGHVYFDTAGASDFRDGIITLTSPADYVTKLSADGSYGWTTFGDSAGAGRAIASSVDDNLFTLNENDYLKLSDSTGGAFPAITYLYYPETGVIANWTGASAALAVDDHGDVAQVCACTSVVSRLNINVVGGVAPVAPNMSYSADSNIPLYIADAYDPDGNAVTLTVVSNPSHGSISPWVDPVTGYAGYTYVTDPDYVGMDSFSYKANDGYLDSSPATVTITAAPTTADAVDLVMTALTGPASVTLGGSVSISSTVKNQGTLNDADLFRVAFYLSADNTLSADDILLVRRAVTSLAAGASNTASTTLSFPVASFAAGNYYIIARADDIGTVPESIELNNTLAKPFTIELTDLVITGMTAPASVDRGTAISVTTTEMNQGAAAVTSNYVKLYLSADATITASDTYLGLYSQVALGAGASADHTMSVTIPVATAAGSYYLGAIADATGTNPESDESNNTYSIPITITSPVDLLVTAMTVPATAGSGLTISVTTTEKNQGTAKSATNYIRLVLSSDTIIDASDTLLKQYSQTALNPGASASRTYSVTIPAGTAAGSYYLGAIADFTNTNSESDESNNTFSKPINIYVPTPDLEARQAHVSPSTAAQRAYLTLTGVLKNVGTAKTGKTTYAGFYLSDGVTDTYLKQVSVPSSLAPGAYQSLSTTYRLPAGFPAGTYTVKVIADHTGALSEIDENNNSLNGDTITVLP